VDNVFGEPQMFEGRMIIPVAEIAYGFGVGFGSGAEGGCDCDYDDFCDCDETCDDDCECDCHTEGFEDACDCDCDCDCEDYDDAPVMGGGGGGGGMARPIAFIEVTAEGATVRPIMDEQKIALAGIFLSAWIAGCFALVLKALFGKK